MLDTLPYLGESAHVATRVGLTYTTDNFYTGGLFKLHNPTDPTTADAETSAYYAVVDAVYYWGDYIAALPDDGDPDIYAQHFDESDHVYSLADWLSILDDEYCGGVNGGYCYASDEVVPTWSQGYPSATEVDAGGPLVHTSEPSGDYADLSYVLVHNFGVSSR